jgi:hypothetical protein
VWEPSGIGLTFVVILFLGIGLLVGEPGLGSYEPTNGSPRFGQGTKKTQAKA